MLVNNTLTNINKLHIVNNVPAILFFLLSKTFLYWADISATWAKTFFIPDLYSTNTQKVCNF